MYRWVCAVFWFMVTMCAVGADKDAGNTLPMPPEFALDAKPEDVFKSYPLGVIPKEAAFAHHGQAHNMVTLPNGLDGWVYENSLSKEETFTAPSGEQREMQSLDHRNVLSTYTLVIGPTGKVIDVLYSDLRRGTAESALLIQRRSAGDTAKEPWRTQHRKTE